MASIVEKYSLGVKYDRRRKLSDQQKEEIKELYKTGCYSYRTLAEKYNVSKRTINNIINPIMAQKSKDRIKKHWRDYQLHGKNRNKQMREYRHYKKFLLNNGVELPKVGTVKGK